MNFFAVLNLQEVSKKITPCVLLGQTWKHCRTLKLHMRGYHKGMLQQSKVQQAKSGLEVNETYILLPHHYTHMHT